MSQSVYAHHAVLILAQAGGHKPFSVIAECLSNWRLMTTLLYYELPMVITPFNQGQNILEIR